MPPTRLGGFLLLFAGALGASFGCSPIDAPASPPARATVADPTPHQKTPTPSVMSSTPELTTFGAGCFWCVEAVLEQLPGVLDVTSGYMGGTVDNPTYKQVCGGDTGHAEVVQVKFDPSTISYDTLLDWFFKLHDPTTARAVSRS